MQISPGMTARDGSALGGLSRSPRGPISSLRTRPRLRTDAFGLVCRRTTPRSSSSCRGDPTAVTPTRPISRGDRPDRPGAKTRARPPEPRTQAGAIAAGGAQARHGASALTLDFAANKLLGALARKVVGKLAGRMLHRLGDGRMDWSAKPAPARSLAHRPPVSICAGSSEPCGKGPTVQVAVI